MLRNGGEDHEVVSLVKEQSETGTFRVNGAQRRPFDENEHRLLELLYCFGDK